MVNSFLAMRNGREKRHFFGLKPVNPAAIKFKLGHYLDLDMIQVPDHFGHIRNDTEWLELGNDKAGCCVVSGTGHETMVWSAAALHKTARFTEDSVLTEYKRVTGWDGVPNSASDTGLDMDEYARHRRTVGVPDADGVIHKIRAYASIPSADNLTKAAYVFGACAIGVKFPQSASIQFDRQQPFTVSNRNSPILGGHYISVVGRNSAHDIVGITWGRLQAMSVDWIERYADVMIAYIPDIDYTNPQTKLTPRMLDMARLDADLAALAA